MAEETPVQRVARVSGIDKEIVEHLSKKWAARTRLDANPWPAEGTFSVPMLIQTEEKVRNYKHKDKGKKRQAKRQKELEVLMEYGKIAGRMERKKKEQEVLDEMQTEQVGEQIPRPPPYSPSGGTAPREATELYPTLPTVTNTKAEYEYTHQKNPQGGPPLREVFETPWEEKPQFGPSRGNIGIYPVKSEGENVRVKAVNFEGPPMSLGRMTELIQLFRQEDGEGSEGPDKDPQKTRYVRTKGPNTILMGEFPDSAFEAEAWEREGELEEERFKEQEEHEFIRLMSENTQAARECVIVGEETPKSAKECQQKFLEALAKHKREHPRMYTSTPRESETRALDRD